MHVLWYKRVCGVTVRSVVIRTSSLIIKIKNNLNKLHVLPGVRVCVCIPYSPGLIVGYKFDDGVFA